MLLHSSGCIDHHARGSSPLPNGCGEAVTYTGHRLPLLPVRGILDFHGPSRHAFSAKTWRILRTRGSAVAGVGKLNVRIMRHLRQRLWQRYILPFPCGKCRPSSLAQSCPENRHQNILSNLAIFAPSRLCFSATPKPRRFADEKSTSQTKDKEENWTKHFWAA